MQDILQQCNSSVVGLLGRLSSESVRLRVRTFLCMQDQRGVTDDAYSEDMLHVYKDTGIIDAVFRPFPSSLLHHFVFGERIREDPIKYWIVHRIVRRIVLNWEKKREDDSSELTPTEQSDVCVLLYTSMNYFSRTSLIRRAPRGTRQKSVGSDCTRAMLRFD